MLLLTPRRTTPLGSSFGLFSSADALTIAGFRLFNLSLRTPLRLGDLRLEVGTKFAVPFRDMALLREKRKLEPAKVILKPAKRRGKKISSLGAW